ncbi:HupE/UreJ family protein [Longispora sp. NPDC051575]|uniref:HupE/UreJ family protein n=1 Tax=Longispora sp. NPDC051575 TaxID=3154943 RepID=UPI003415BEC4
MTVSIRRALAALAGLLVLTLPVSASAHGIGPAAGKTVWEFLPLGAEHMLLGFDHLLFIAGVLLLAGGLRRAATLISVFAAGHSLTLITATLAGWKLNANLVEVVIALSVVFVGMVAFLGRPKTWSWFTGVVFAFGLVHGLGLATRFQDLRLPDKGLLAKLIAFNVGIELGQLLAITIMMMAAHLVIDRTRLRPGLKVSSVPLVAAGLGFAVWMTFFPPAPVNPHAAYAIGSCQVRDRTETFEGDSGHPARAFTEPGQPAPEAGFAHVIGDGYVIVQYRPDLPAGDVDSLRGHITDPGSGRIVAGPAPQQKEALKAVHAYNTLTCSSYDLPALKEFSRAWFADPRSKPVE